MNNKEGKFTDKSGLVLSNNLLSALLRIQRSYQSTHSLRKHEQHRTFPVFHSGRNEFYDQNILYCRLLGLSLVLTEEISSSPNFVDGYKCRGNYQTFDIQPSSPAMGRAINSKKFWYLSPKFIAQIHPTTWKD